MQITKETIDRLPSLEFTKFDGNKVICWDSNFFVATLEIEETIPSCIVDKKTKSKKLNWGHGYGYKKNITRSIFYNWG